MTVIVSSKKVICLSVLFVCLLPMAGWTARPIKTKLGIGTHVDPGSVLVKIKVIYRGPQGRDNRSSAKCDKYGRQRPERAERIEARRAETTPSGGLVLTASLHNKRQYDCLFVCLFVADGRPNGWANQDQTWHRVSRWPKECFSQGQGHWHGMRYNRIHDRIHDRKFMSATPRLANNKETCAVAAAAAAAVVQ